jgi:hypothetical protein
MSNIYFNESSNKGGLGISITDEFDILKYVNEYDCYNSFLFYILPNILTSDYTITKFKGRVDLLSNEIFGNPLYYSILLFLNPYSKFELKEVIQIINKDQLNSLFQQIQSENEIAKSFSNDI